MKLKKLYAILSVVTALLLSGCTTYVVNTKKSPGFNEKIKEVYIFVVAKRNHNIRISRSHRQSLRDDDRKNAAEGVKKIVSVFTKHAKKMVSDELKKNKVTVVEKPTPGSMQLTMSPTKGRAECAPLACNYFLYINVGLVSRKNITKIVWRGQFKVGAPLEGEQNAEVIKNFTDSLISELKSDKLI